MKNQKTVCSICGEKLNKYNDASIEILGQEFMNKIKDYKKIQTVCMDCKHDLLYAAIVSPF
jgi:hypothetical protein